ncbi:ribose-phosphate pyrophosphokinase [Candidatus Woesearchaeota archaeon]|nr:ribose-phosphate pyrophosphokinase [Candidatus Woesearchaeota archaeon]
MPRGELKLFACRSGEHFAKRVAAELKSRGCTVVGLEDYVLTEFECGENKQHCIGHSVRESDVYIFQSSVRDSILGYSVDDNFMQLARFVDGMRNASAGSITVVLPLAFYARQDKIWERGEPFSAKLAAEVLQTAGANRVVTMELHSDQMRGYFDIHIEPLHFSYVALDYLRGRFQSDLDRVAFGSTDAGGGERAKHYHKKIGGSSIVFGNKIKSYGTMGKTVERIDIVGDVKGKVFVPVDDMIDTGGTMVMAARTAKSMGATNVYAIAAHGLFNGKAIQNFNDAFRDGAIDEVVVSDSVYHDPQMLEDNPWLKEISVAGLFAEVIQKLHHGEGVSEVYRS